MILGEAQGSEALPMHVAQGVGVQNNDGHVPALASSHKLVLLLLLLYLLVVTTRRIWASPSASSFCTVLLGLVCYPPRRV